MPDILREHPVIAARQHGDRTSAEAAQLGHPIGVLQNIDGIELDRTDREKLFEFQAARSARLPENLQRDIRTHAMFSVMPQALSRPARGVNCDIEPAAPIEVCPIARAEQDGGGIELHQRGSGDASGPSRAQGNRRPARRSSHSARYGVCPWPQYPIGRRPLPARPAAGGRSPTAARSPARPPGHAARRCTAPGAPRGTVRRSLRLSREVHTVETDRDFEHLLAVPHIG